MSSDEREVVPGVLRGYRSWRINTGGQLLAISFPDPWERGKNTASCAAGYSKHPHVSDEPFDWEPAPSVWCTCGLYAMHLPHAVSDTPFVIHGSIKAYGKVILHENGFRAQYAEIEALYVHPAFETDRSLLPYGYGVPIYASGAELLYHHPPISVEHLIPRWTPTGYWEPDPLRAEEPSE